MEVSIIIKEMVCIEIKNLSLFTHLHGISNPFSVIQSVEHERKYFDIFSDSSFPKQFIMREVDVSPTPATFSFTLNEFILVRLGTFSFVFCSVNLLGYYRICIGVRGNKIVHVYSVVFMFVHYNISYYF